MVECSYETPRLRVSEWSSGTRRLRSFDLPSFVAQLLTPNVTAALPESWRGPYSRTRAAAWIEARDLEGATLLVEDRTSGDPIGLVLLHDSPEAAGHGRDLRLGYLIAESHWGCGYATELLRGFVGWARTAPHRRIVAGVASGHAASIRVLEKSGFCRLDETTGSEGFYVLEV